jgi:LDH2 family malate/lactate/ureidoglycolate dehydrogenase
VRLPGQAGLKLREQALSEGVRLAQKVIDELNKTAGQLQLPVLS